MADTHSVAHDQHPTHAARGSDMIAAFAGLIIGVVVLVLLVVTIVKLTNRHYESEKPAAAESR
ncbi:MAG TPA: hypothetical protein VGH98_10780 [Gemmatimonadaceae bacterium]